MQLSKKEYARKRIHNPFFGANRKFRHSGKCSASRGCRVMPNSYPRDGIFNQHLTIIKDSYIPNALRLCSYQSFCKKWSATGTLIVLREYFCETFLKISAISIFPTISQFVIATRVLIRLRQKAPLLVPRSVDVWNSVRMDFMDQCWLKMLTTDGRRMPCNIISSPTSLRLRWAKTN